MDSDDDSLGDIPDDEKVFIPRHSDPFVRNYLSSRQALIDEEKKQRADATFHKALSPTAKEANAIVSRLRKHEQETIWKEESRYPGMPFVKARPTIEKTRLYQIMRRFPKGSLLHVHLDAMMRLEILIHGALEEKGICIIADGPLTKESRDTQQFSFDFLPNEATANKAKACDIWTSGYEAKLAVPVVEAAEAFPKDGRDGFKLWLADRLTITDREAMSQHDGINPVWHKFASTFQIIAGLFYYEPIYRKCLRQMFRDLIDDHIRWVEFRMCFVHTYKKLGRAKADVNHQEMVAVLVEEIDIFKQSEAGKNFWGAKLIWTALRSDESPDVLDTLIECTQAKMEYPKLIAGFDLVGQEDPGRPLTSLLPELFFFKKKMAQNKYEAPFFFHCGETLGSGTDADSNLFDAFILGSRRLGHANSLFKHPLLMDMIVERGVCVEICPISEEILGLTHNINAHPGISLILRGVPCAICCDDPMQLRAGPDGAGRAALSMDFYQAIQGWEALGLAGLGSLAENSVRYSAFINEDNVTWGEKCKKGVTGKGIKARHMREWKKDWEEFCEWVVGEFGKEFGDESPAALAERPVWQKDEEAWEDEGEVEISSR